MTIAQVFMVLVLAFFVLVAVIAARRFRAHRTRLRDWVPAEATVVGAELVQSWNGNDNQRRYLVTWRYRTPDGVERDSPGRDPMFSAPVIGSVIPIRYDPAAPEQSAWMPPMGTPQLAVYGCLGVLFVVLAIFFAFFARLIL
ncbi:MULTISPECIES: DUF3592 domain-containing protein [unclassified Nocardioides]|uniref:DUF3592 domain-containing protein n=1 Tax=unclassified Nocardioides TaxID=2615069 RepID=UPI0006FDD661|nr:MULTISPECIES: DUF3592 domain-containing protein [unclassified Nocardioides]KQY57103.1 hypothetical protein ASD30_12675 [Nocardioides sp. Root140]KQZ68611.1 hypothetical protein ASD66_15085 [Nocardioides sp. Root151]KRF11743.1 hypothetical protein ASH02_17320 [Nocardioides sp. Soil796]